MDVSAKKNITSKLIALICLSAILIFSAGCAPDGKGGAEKNVSGADTIQEEVLGRIAKRILREVNEGGRLAEVRGRQVLRVALPPEDPPFQYLDPDLGIPGGFSTAIVSEIALILGVKPNIELLDEDPGKGGLPDQWQEEYDIVSMSGKSGACPPENEFKYYYMGPSDGWKILCVAGESDSLLLAVDHIFSYLNETGIYIRLYREYVEN